MKKCLWFFSMTFFFVLLISLGGANSALREDKGALLARSAALEDKNTVLQNQLDAAQLQLVEEQTQNLELQSDAAAQENELSALVQQTSALKKALQTVNEKMQRSAATCAALQKQLQTLQLEGQRRNSAAETAACRAQAQIRFLQDALAANLKASAAKPENELRQALAVRSEEYALLYSLAADMASQLQTLLPLLAEALPDAAESLLTLRHTLDELSALLNS